MIFIKKVLFVFILFGAALILYRTLIPVHFLEYNTPYFAVRFPGDPYHMVKSDYDLWDVSTSDSYYFVYVYKLDQTADVDQIAEISKLSFIENIDEEFEIPSRFKRSSYVSYIDEDGAYWRFVFITVPENNSLYQIGLSSKKDNLADFKFFFNTLKIKSINDVE